MGVRGRDLGQASVELVAVLPVLIVLVLAAVQMAIAGYGLWSSAGAARAGVRAAYVGDDANAAARKAIPQALRSHARVDDSGPVTVVLRIPSLIPGVRSIPVAARAGLGPADG